MNEACVLALALDMLDVRRLERMLALGHATPPPAPTGRVLPRPRYLGPAQQYALPLVTPPSIGETV